MAKVKLLSNTKNILGVKFSNLTVIREDRVVAYSHGCKVIYMCKCICGKETSVAYDHLKSGHTTSCGCIRAERLLLSNTVHGLHKHPIYRVWAGIISRCENPNNTAYANYGGRGIRICLNWRNDFLKFYGWAIKNGWAKGLSIERKKVSKGYTPNNCTWATKKEQNRNKRDSVFITINGISKNISQWAEEKNMGYNLLRYRFKVGWPTHKLFIAPIGKK